MFLPPAVLSHVALPGPPPAPEDLGDPPLQPLVAKQPHGLVGGCLQRHVQQWRDIGADDFCLDILTNGYSPDFKDQAPPLTREWQDYESATSPLKKHLLGDQVVQLLGKNAIEKIRNNRSQGFYSNVFLVPKKNGTWRPVINLSALNQFLSIPTFKMESSQTISAAIRPGDWATSIDLTDGYFHVPIARFFRKYLRFVINNVAYQFRALPFGLSTAPLVFTRLLQPLAIYVHLKGHLLHRYIDDLLPRQQIRLQVYFNTQFLLDVLHRLGWRVNEGKSMLIPSQDFTYVGVHYLTHRGVMIPPDDRIAKIILAILPLLRGSVTARYVLSVLGLLNSAERQVPKGRIHLRPIQMGLRAQFRIGIHPLESQVSFHDHPDSIQALQWWSQLENLTRGQPLGPFLPQLTIYTDATLQNWGAHDQNDLQLSGQWTPHEASLSINQLELLAVTRALQQVPPSWSGKRVLVATDNTTTVAYINHQGGTKSMLLLDLSYDLFKLLEQRDITLQARHIPGRLNRLADLLSRKDSVVNTEWTLSHNVTNLIWEVWGRPMIDLMATHLNNRLPTFVSPFPHDLAYAVDAMSFTWQGMDAYLFPPWSMIASVLDKLQTENDCILTLIVPKWPKQPWWPLLVDLLCDVPRELPLRPDLLMMPISKAHHQNLAILHLHACRVSSNPSRIRAFHEKCRLDSPKATKDDQLSRSMKASGRSSHFGASQGISILSLPL